MTSALVQSMLENSVHIGHKSKYWSPKMRDYIYGVQNDIHVFDLYKTEKKLEEMKEVLKGFAEKGKSILFVGTKVQTRNLVEVLSKENGHFFVSSKWVP
jgi:small subunit ribosomal protein S2